MATRRRPSRPAGSPERWLILCRQSDTDDAGERSLSLESQERVLRDAAAQREAVVVAAVRDADLRGYQDETERPALAEALQRASRQEYDVLAVWELSRLARKLSLQERVLEEMERHGVRLYSHREPWASATMVRQILGAVAEEQTRTISAHVGRAIRERMRTGRWHGRRPYGYQVGPDGRLVIDETTAPWVREIFTRYARGVPVAEIARWLNASLVPVSVWSIQGPQLWVDQSVRRITRNPTYIGSLVSGDMIVPDAHPAIIDEATWQAVRHRIANEPTGRRYGRVREVETFLGEGRIRCGCGRPLYPNSRAMQHRQDSLKCKRVDGVGFVDDCTARRKSITVAEAERRVRDLLSTDLARLRPWRSVAAELRRSMTVTEPDRASQRRRAERQRSDLLTRRDRTHHLFIAGHIDSAELDRLLAPMTDELRALEAELATTPVVQFDDRLREASALAQSYRGLIRTATTEDMMSIVRRLDVTAHLDVAVEGAVRLTYGEPLRHLINPERDT